MRCLSCLSFVLLLAAVFLNAQSPDLLSGEWSGTLQVPGGATLRLALHLARGSDGKWTGSLDSLDQGAMGMPLSAVTLDGASVSIELARPAATLAGTLNPSGAEITGEWRQGGASLPLTIKRVAHAPTLDRPQEAALLGATLPYRSEDVDYPTKTAAVHLAGTLTLPSTGGPFPAVLLITGSGAQNRNEELLGHKPFLILADHLTRAGIAVLRVDDRGTGQSTGDFAASTTADFIDDAAASVAYLRSRKDIDAKRIGLLGHSEGGVIAPALALRDSQIAFVVMMAGTGVSGREVLKSQAAAILRASGASEADGETNRKNQDLILSLSDPKLTDAERAARARQIEATLLASVPEERREAMRTAIHAQITMGSSPWMRYFVNLDPSETLNRLKTPVLALNGALDTQVIASQNLPAIAAALEKAGNPDYQISKLPNLNHLFQTATTGGPAEYARIPETIAPIALDVITDWILRRVR